MARIEFLMCPPSRRARLNKAASGECTAKPAAGLRCTGAAFARSSGHTLVYVSDTTGALQKRLAAGEKADLVIVAGPGMDMLQKP